jgi:hypothetical protein
MTWVVTAKQSSQRREPGSVVPALVAIGVLMVTAVYGIAHGFTSAVANNLAFAGMYAAIMLYGIWPALTAAPTSTAAHPDTDADAAELEAA